AGAAVGAAGGVAGAGVTDQVAELRKGLVEVPLVAEDRDGVEVDAEPGAAGLAQDAVEGRKGRELAAEGEHDAVAVGAAAEFGESAVDLRHERWIGRWRRRRRLRGLRFPPDVARARQQDQPRLLLRDRGPGLGRSRRLRQRA